MIPNILVKRLHEKARLPERAHNSAGYDLFAAKDVLIAPGEVAKIPIGISVEFPPGLAAFIWDRSSYGSKGLHRFAGVIDSDYRGEWTVVMYNSTQESAVIYRGDKVAQFVLQPVASLEVLEVEELSDTSRGAGGFGSTD